MSKVIETLTPEQQARIPEYLERYRAIGYSTAPTNRALAEDALRASYKYLAKTIPECVAVPEIVWAKNPLEGAVMAAKIAKGDDNVTEKEIQAQADMASYGSFDAYWVSTYAFIAQVLPVDRDELIYICIAIVENCGVHWSFEGLIVACDKPTVIQIENDVLHCVDGPALAFGADCSFYYYKGAAKNSLAEVVIQQQVEKDGVKT